MVEIALFEGSRDCLAPLFSEADDSESEIAAYRDLGDVLVACQSGEIIGQALIVETSKSGVFELKSLAVQEERRSRGIGAELVAAAAQHCGARGGRVMLVATAAASIGALQFYQRQGFRFRRIIRDFYSAERGYRPLDLNGIPLLDEIILDLALVDG
jgi:ribosomal protein S18 acetylase RimI-like enzyme